MADRRRTWTYLAPLSVGLFTFFALVVFVWFWGVNTSITGAVIGNGQVLATTTQTAVQHPKGGVVTEIYARNGDRVEAGALLIQLDDRELRSKLASTLEQLAETMLNEARLDAIVTDEREITLPPDYGTLIGDTEKAEVILRRQQAQLDTHYENLEASAALTQQQIVQVNDQIEGIRAEIAAQRERLELVEKELENSEELMEKGLVKVSVYYTQQKDKTTTRGTIAKLQARIAELKGKVSELEFKQKTFLPGKKEKAATELNRLKPQKAKLLEARVLLLQQMEALQVRSPVAGRVHESQVAGIRSVMQAAKPAMFIVPGDAPLTAEVRVHADDIDQVFPGQEALLRFSAFSKRKTPLVYGTVDTISPDALLDPKTRKPYYKVWVALTPKTLETLGELKLVAGMPVTAFITTEDRSPISYVTKPLWNYIEKAFRDA